MDFSRLSAVTTTKSVAMPTVANEPRRTSVWLIVSVILGGLVVLAAPFLVLRSFLFQPFNTPSGSMEPTLQIGDYFFASKYPYGFSRYSLPYSPSWFSGRIFGAEPRYGDLVVYRLPGNLSVDYIKRVVGLPGDRVQMIAGQLYLNGAPVKHERLTDVIVGNGRAKKWRETLPNGVSYETLDLVENGALDNTKVYIVPPGHYFMLGDNRDNSQDSRVAVHGDIPFENLIGRAEIVFWSADPNAQGGSSPARFERIGKRLR